MGSTEQTEDDAQSASTAGHTRVAQCTCPKALEIEALEARVVLESRGTRECAERKGLPLALVPFRVRPEQPPKGRP